MKTFLFILSFLITSWAHASDTVIKYGANVPTETENLGTTKAIFIGQQFHLVGPLISQIEGGGWFDNSGEAGRRSSALFGGSLGINVDAHYAFAQALVGPALITRPDSALGGPLQFNNDVAIGLRDPSTGATVGLNYKHVSSAGIETPNRGRDFWLFRVSFSW